jgi:hypothetical protein
MGGYINYSDPFYNNTFGNNQWGGGYRHNSYEGDSEWDTYFNINQNSDFDMDYSNNSAIGYENEDSYNLGFENESSVTSEKENSFSWGSFLGGAALGSLLGYFTGNGGIRQLWNRMTSGGDWFN